MIVCHCRGVNDHQIRTEIERGARGAELLAQQCGAGARCGGCLPALRRLLAEHGAADGQVELAVTYEMAGTSV